MAYTIVKSDGTVLTTIPDGTIDTTSTSLGLPGRSFSGYGQAQDTNFVHLTENFAAATPPPNPLRGQIWYNTSTNTVLVCPADGEANAAAWLSLTSTSSGSTTTFGNVSVSGSITTGNLTVSNALSAGSVSTDTLTVTSNANIANATLSGTTVISSLNTTVITTGSANTNGTLTGTWTVAGNGVANNVNGTALWVTDGNVVITGAGGIGIRTDNYMYANGVSIPLGGTYGNSNVELLLPTYAANVGTVGGATVFNGRTLSTGANSTTGNITGRWALTAGSQLTATYADLAERFAADDVYTPGTVVELGGKKEITIVKDELSEKVFGVVSNTAAKAATKASEDAAKAANAATDAALEAVKAADAAILAAENASASVAKLAKSVNAALANLKKQITSLTALVNKLLNK
jgi:hypothetical protein